MKKKVLPSSSNENPTSSKKPRGVASVALRGPVSPSPKVQKGNRWNEESLTLDIHLTVRRKVQISRRKLTLLAAMKVREVLLFGIDLGEYILLEYLLNSLVGSRKTLELKEEREKETSLVIQLVLQSSRPSFEKKEIPEDVRSFAESSKWIPNKRSYYSWRENLVFDKYLTVETVPVESVFERSLGSKRYSSYTKGYGETGPDGHKKRTPPSAELDGEPVSLEKEGENLPIQMIQFYISFQELERKYKAISRKK